jgi:thioredoxin 1
MKNKTSARSSVLWLLLMLTLLLFINSCGHSQEKTNNTTAITKVNNEPAKTNNKQNEPKVTFIELGSVNCIPCKMMQPIMKEIEEEYAAQVKVVFYDVWTEAGRPYASQYRISVIPTQVFLDAEGKEYYRHQGFFPKDELVKILKQKGVN